MSDDGLVCNLLWDLFIAVVVREFSAAPQFPVECLYQPVSVRILFYVDSSFLLRDAPADLI